ncbi:MAG: sigma 54-interacting transcriptional regulator [Treponema sp.]|jgi:Nif-specific regulatory protein|nr:sigma 54-interacting transcriptional regulator [Treponema sp.]
MLSQIDIHKFNTLIEINTLINSNYQDVHALLTHILESATRLCDGDASSIMLLDKEANALYFEVALGSKRIEIKRFTLKPGEGIAGWVVQHNKPVIVNDVVNDERHFRSIPQQIDYSSKTMMAVPMRVKDECIGVIELINKKHDRYFVQEDLEWLEIFANQAALAIVNAQSIEKAQSEIQILRAQLQTDKGYHTLIAKSRIVLEKLEIIERIAQTDSSVLILGESGVGKELFAEQIHLRSKRSDHPLIRVNCAALPEGLLESELFGHVKGAFTGAVSDRQGRFEASEGGTIFLDEIGDISPALQAKLLRVIQQKTFEKVGSDVSVTVNVRILAATNKDIETLVAQGKFRSDLYYRLNVLPLYIPPLRQRPEDIPELGMFFLKRCMQETNKHFDGFSSEAMEAMLSYSWPGNVREMENCVERACVIGKNKWIGEEDLFLNKRVIPGFDKEGSRNLKTAVTLFKTHFIKKVLEEHRWNQTEAAKSLDIQRTYLSKLIKELVIINPKEE